jgi:hypothetical protein
VLPAIIMHQGAIRMHVAEQTQHVQDDRLHMPCLLVLDHGGARCSGPRLYLRACWRRPSVDLGPCWRC